MNTDNIKELREIKDRLVVVDRKELSIKVPDERTLLRLVINLEAQPREYFIVET